MREFVQIMRQAILAEEEIDEAVEVPDTPYGYWVRPDGSIVSVDFFQHGRVMRSIDEDLWTYGDAFEAGWIRVVAEHGQLMFETTTGLISTRALMAIQAMCRLPQYGRYVGEIGQSYKEMDDPKLFMRYVRRERKEHVA